jgi:hypothetical protein
METLSTDSNGRRGELAPIALFTYNRPEHTRRTIEALKLNDLASESDLFVFSDGAKNPDLEQSVKETRELLRTVTGFKSITIIERPTNFGLAASIIDGVTRLTAEFGKIIVLEDDLVTVPQFLAFMNEGLDVYHDEPAIVSIHGYIYPVKKQLPDTFFLPGADCWGWATWKRGWDVFEKDGVKLRAALKHRDLEDAFNFGGSNDYIGMLDDQIAGKNNSWAIRWYASAFLAGKVTLYPGQSLVLNIGNDGSGTHSTDTEYFTSTLAQRKLVLVNIPIEVDMEAYNTVSQYFRSLKRSFLSRLKQKLMREWGKWRNRQ